jgi:hypothetical protein
MELILASNRAVAEDVGLIFTFFILMGGVVGVLLAYMAIQIRGERQQNREYRNAGRSSADVTGR